MTAIITAIIAIAKAVPYISSLLNMLMNEWQNYQISQIDNSIEAKKKRLDYLTLQLKVARNDTERMVAFRALVALG